MKGRERERGEKKEETGEKRGEEGGENLENNGETIIRANENDGGEDFINKLLHWKNER